MEKPPLYGDPDHMDNYVVTSSDNGGVHTNSGILNKVAFLIKQGGEHNDISVTGLDYMKADKLVISTLLDTGLTSTADFYEYRDVMLQRCNELIGVPLSFTTDDCQQVFKAWCSVGFCYLTQNIVGLTNDDWDFFGKELASGNFNGDDYEDLAVGIPCKDYDGVFNAGMVAIFYGSPMGLGATEVELIGQHHAGNLNQYKDMFGRTLTAGNFNGDVSPNGFAYDDLAVGVPYEDYNGHSDVGIVIIFYGSNEGLLLGNSAITQVLSQEDVSNIDIVGAAEPSDFFGFSLASGDFNGDEFDDLAVGVIKEDHSGLTDAGVVNVFYGSDLGLGESTSMPPSVVIVSLWDATENKLGIVLTSGDFNGDGYDDLAAGAPYWDLTVAGTVISRDAGIVFFMFGSITGLDGLWFTSAIAHGHAGLTPIPRDYFGMSLAASDFNGDGFDDLAVGVPDRDVGPVISAGMVIIFYGSTTGLLTGGLATYEVIVQEDLAGISEGWDRFGSKLASGNFTGDAFADLAIGAWSKNIGDVFGTGIVVVCSGSIDGLLPAAVEWIDQESGLGGQNEQVDRFGVSLASGDFNGNGLDDLAIGADCESFPGGIEYGGAVYIKEY
jgi:hypothetical protein